MSRPTSKDGKDGEDLNSILDDSQRTDVTLLIANCSEAMRTILIQNFDAEAGLDKTLMPAGKSDEDKFMETDPSKADVGAYDKERKLKEECEKDINSHAAKKLKKEVLKAYDEWREQVMMRIGEAVNSKSTAKEQLEQETEPRSPKPKAPTTSGKIADGPDRNPNLKFKDLFPPTKTPLTKLPMDQRTLILHAILLLLISLEHYNAYSRILMLNLTSSLKLSLRTFEQDEYTTGKGLLESAKELSATEETEKRQHENRENRKWKVGLATAAGAAILGVSGGLAAPLVASGVGSVMGGLGLGATAAAGYLGSVAGSTILVGGIFGAYGGRMTGQMMDKYAREVEDFEFLPVHSDKKTSEEDEQGAQEASEHDHKLRVTICISGWLTEKSEVTKPWRVLGTGAEVFGLKWELETLLNLGHAMDGMMQSAAWGYAQKEIIKRTIFAELMSALWPVGLLKVARVLDNPFSVAKARADKAGEVLADALINKAQGERPVTLIGYSLGARVIYTCLKTLAERKAFGLVENAVIIGGPTPSDTSHWRVLRTAVSGRLINVYSQNDYLLGFMYRTSALQYGVAGLQPIRGLAGIENVDVSEDIDGHTRYRFLVGGILKKIGFEDIDLEAVKEEQEALEKMLRVEKKNSLQAQRKRLMRRESYKDEKVDEDEEAEVEASDMEKQVKTKTEKSMMARIVEWWYTPRTTNKKDADKAASTLQQAIQNPEDAKAAAGDAVADAQKSAQSYTSYIASKLPSMPGGGSSSDPTSKTEDTSKAAKDATATTGSYIETAKEYLPNMPFRSKPEPKKPETATEKATDTAQKAASGAQEGAKQAAGITKDVVQPTVNNVLNPQDNPAVQAAKDTAKNAPVVNQAAENVPGAKEAAQVTSDTVGTTVQNTSQQASSAVNTTVSKAADTGSGAAKAASTGASKATGVAKGAAKATGVDKAKDTGEGIAKAGMDGAGKAGDTAKGAAGQTSPAASKLADTGLNITNAVASGAGKATNSGQEASTSGAGKAAEVGRTATGTAASGANALFSAGQSLTGQSKPQADSRPSKELARTPSTPKTPQQPKQTESRPKLQSEQSGSKVAAPATTTPADAAKSATNTVASGANALTNVGKSLLGQARSAAKPSTPAQQEPVKSPQTPQQSQEKSQSYFSMASSYIPSLPTSSSPKAPSTTTSTTTTNNVKRSPPKLGKRPANAEQVKSQTPAPSTPQNSASQTATPRPPQESTDRKPSTPSTPSTTAKSKPPKLTSQSRTPSKPDSVKSPPKKLGPKKQESVSTPSTPAAVKAPPPKLSSRDSNSTNQSNTPSTGGAKKSSQQQEKSWTGAATNAATNTAGGLAGKVVSFGKGTKLL